MMRLPLFALLAAALGVLPACADPDPEPVPMAVPEPLPPPPPPADGPGLDTISVEGEPMAIRVAPYETPMGFPLPFTTRLPADLEAESLASGEGDAIRFTIAGLPETVLNVFVPADASMTARAAADYAAALGATAPLANPPVWSRASFSAFTDDAYFVTVHFTHHADRPVFVSTRYPGDAADGMAPRFGYVIDRIRWSDTGRLLIDG